MGGGAAVVAIGKGNPRKPSLVKEQQGTARADQSNPAEPRPDPINISAPPPGMTKEQITAWHWFAKLVDPMRISTAGDLAAFELMVKSWVLCATAEDSLRKPMVVDVPPKKKRKKLPDVGPLLYIEWGATVARVKPRPELLIIATHSKILLYQFSRFGLTPADRSRVSELEQVRPGDKKGVEEFE